jgi:ankyrin repeat protein
MSAPFRHPLQTAALPPRDTRDIWQAIEQDDAAALSGLVRANPALLSETKSVALGRRSVMKMTPVHYAASLNRKHALEALFDNGADMEQATADGFTPLLLTGRAGALDAMTFLHEKGACLNAQSRSGRTALNDACRYGREDVVAFLLAHGARTDILSPSLMPDIVVAAEQGHTAIVARLLDHGADIDTHDSETRTPLWWALYRGFQDTAALLLDRGADEKAASRDGMTMLMAAVSGGDENAARRLIAKGLGVNDRTPGGDTALHYSAYSEKEEDAPALAALLLQKGAWLDSRNSQNETPLESARRMKRGKLAGMFAEAAKDQSRPKAGDLNPAVFNDGIRRKIAPMKQLTLRRNFSTPEKF